jgi:hypothetical protein
MNVTEVTLRSLATDPPFSGCTLQFAERPGRDLGAETTTSPVLSTPTFTDFLIARENLIKGKIIYRLTPLARDSHASIIVPLREPVEMMR